MPERGVHEGNGHLRAVASPAQIGFAKGYELFVPPLRRCSYRRRGRVVIRIGVHRQFEDGMLRPEPVLPMPPMTFSVTPAFSGIVSEDLPRWLPLMALSGLTPELIAGGAGGAGGGAGAGAGLGKGCGGCCGGGPPKHIGDTFSGVRPGLLLIEDRLQRVD